MRAGYVVTPPVANSYLVRERDRRRLREMLLVVLVVVPLGVASLSYAWIQLELLRVGRAISDQERELAHLRDQERSLAVDSARLLSPPQIEAVGRALGLQAPNPGQVLFAVEAGR